MRVTVNSLNRHIQHVIQGRYGDLAALQEQLSTGKRLLRPSDNPTDVTNDLKLRSKLDQTEQFKKNLQDGMAFMSVSDTAMVSMNTLMQRMRELAIQGGNDTLSSKERTYIQKETEQLTRQMISLANTNYKGDYVFGGTESKIVPFPMKNSRGESAQDYATFGMAYYDPAGQLRNGFDNTPITNVLPGTFTLSVAGTNYVEGTDYSVDYVTGMMTIINPALNVPNAPGSAGYALGQFKISFDYVSKGTNVYGDTTSTRGDVLREIEPDIAMPINVSGAELMTDPNTGTDAIQTLIRFNQRLLTGSTPAINSSITELDNVFKTILSAQSRNGARMNRFETTLDRNDTQNTQISDLQSSLEDAEMAETITKFNLNQTVYDAALKSAAMVIQKSLVDFL